MSDQAPPPPPPAEPGPSLPVDQATPAPAPVEPDLRQLIDVHEAALSRLVALKGNCFAICTQPEEAVTAIEPGARQRAVVAQHVLLHGTGSVAAALAAGSLRHLDQTHVAEVSRVAELAAGGQDPITAAGADSVHVALLEAARQAHLGHGAELAAAYAEQAAASKQRADLENALAAERGIEYVRAIVNSR